MSSPRKESSRSSSKKETSKSSSPSKKEESAAKPIKTVEEINKEKAEELERQQKIQDREIREREERRAKERERERKQKEARLVEQERRERERRERARKEAERVRREREKQREVEKAREREREKERERFIRERKESEDRKRREKEREREIFERERMERERLERERKERERLEAERMERERQERERLERERIERETRLEKERLRLERAHLERERMEREQQRRAVVSQGMKRPANNSDYRYSSENKRSYRDEPERKPFFGGATDTRGNLKDDLFDMAYRRNVVDSKKEREYEPRENETRRRDTRVYPPQHKEDIRRVVESDSNRYSPSRDRSPHRQQYDSRGETRFNARGGEFERREKAWLDAPNSNAPKTLSDVLGRAGLTGILGSKAENDVRGGDGGFPRAPEREYERPERNDYNRNTSPRNAPARSDPYKIDNRQAEERRVVHQTERRDSREDYRDSAPRREPRPEERKDRFDDRRREATRKDPYMSERGAVTKDNFPRRESSSYGANEQRGKDTYSNDRKDAYGKNDTRKPENAPRYESHDRRGENRRDDTRRDSRTEDPRRESYHQPKTIDRGINQSRPLPPHSRHENRSVTERRGLHPLAAEIVARPMPAMVHTAPPGGVVGSANVYGRVMPQPGSIRPGFPPGSQAVTMQVPPPNIQLRDGRLEFTRVAPPGANIQPFPRRF